ncbi:hypothetical protein BGZ76_000034 [Entomortierella beljakovae]|nr:hypothetical protein BGZ76_000034 [Entomortierella beljakovae]
MGMHSLYTPITSCSLQRRREEYRKLGFTLHQEFSRALVELMEQSQDSVSCLEIQDNFLDLEMTELIFCIVRYGRHLEHLLYDGNKDGGFVEPQVVSAITAACPTMKSFHGQHGISDIVLRRMMTGWEELRSITLAPYQSSESSTLSTKEVSLDGLWSLLECRKVEVLELLDLHCISNEGACALLERVKQLESMSLYPADHPTSPIIPNHPFSHHSPQFLPNPGPPKLLPGASVRHLILTKYTSSPITLPGFAALLKLFPNLETLRFTTNYFAYDHQFQGLTKGIYEQEIHMVESIVKQEMSERWLPGRASACWYGEWHADLTEEQRLRVGHFIPNH